MYFTDCIAITSVIAMPSKVILDVGRHLNSELARLAVDEDGGLLLGDPKNSEIYEIITHC